MLISKKNRRAVYEYAFKEGVLVAKKDFHQPKHDVLTEVPNLEVIKAMQSLKSRGYATERFAWRHFYWYLTDAGINYLREYLHVPAEVVPDTLKPKVRPPSARPAGPSDRPARPSRFGAEGDRDSYRRGGFGGDKKTTGAGSDFKPEFRGGAGFGRGRGSRAAPKE